MYFFNNHNKLFLTAFALFVGLTIIIAVIPAYNNQKNNAVLPNAVELNEDQIAGRNLYVANGCVACHSQQVRNVDMDKVFGDRPSIAADYAGASRMDIWRNTATLMGTERTGPDLTSIGNRQPSLEWHLLHLYQPRAVVEQSIMPAYSWLFELKSTVGDKDVVITVPPKYSPAPNLKVVASKEALQLVAYLQSLKPTVISDGRPVRAFLYPKAAKSESKPSEENLPDGEQLYVQNCQSCHQANGEGLMGAFPPLKGSAVVTGDDLELYVNIIMKGYDARPEFASMPAIGTTSKFTAADITALINHERSSWGNTAKPISKKEVEDILKLIK